MCNNRSVLPIHCYLLHYSLPFPCLVVEWHKGRWVLNGYSFWEAFFFFLFSFFVFERECQQANAKCIKNLGRCAHCEGRWRPLDVPHCHIKVKEPSNESPDQGPLPKPPSAEVTNDLHTLSFQVPHDFHSIPSTKNIPSSPGFIEAFEGGFNWVYLISTNLIILAQATLAHITKSSQMRCFILDSCHYSWLNTPSFHSIQIIQSVMSQRRCQILIVLTNLLGILSPKRVCFRLTLL